MKKHSIKVGGREFPLAFTLGALEKMEGTFPGVDITKVDSSLATTAGLLNMIYILAECGAKTEGQMLDVGREWFANHIPASNTAIARIYQSVVDTMVDWMSMETEQEDADREVDVVLDEIKKNGNRED